MYAARLLESLQQHPEIEEITVVGHRRVVAAEDVLDRSRANASPWSLPHTLGRRGIPFRRPIASWIRGRAIIGQLRRGGWTLFHEPNYVSPPLDAPLVTTVCDMSYARHPEYLPRDRQRWLATKLEPCLRRSAAVITISQFVRNEILDAFPWLDEKRLFVTPLGVDHTEFHPHIDPSAIDEVRRRWQLPPQFVLYLGTLEPRKNVKGLLDGYSLLPRELQQEFPLVVAGATGWRKQGFWRQLDGLCSTGMARRIGYVDVAHVPSLMSAATVFCFPSIYEGFGLPPLEAAACGTPVICGAAAAVPEVMGDAAAYVDPLDPQNIAAESAARDS